MCLWIEGGEEEEEEEEKLDEKKNERTNECVKRERLGASGAGQTIHMYTTTRLTERVPNVHYLKPLLLEVQSITERRKDNTQDNLKGQVKPIHLVQSLTTLCLERSTSSPPQPTTNSLRSCSFATSLHSSVRPRLHNFAGCSLSYTQFGLISRPHHQQCFDLWSLLIRGPFF